MPQSNRRTILRASVAGHLATARAALRASISAVATGLSAGRQAKGDVPRVPVTSEQVERAIRGGINYLKSQQLPDGSWPNPRYHHQHTVGPTSLVIHSLLIAGEAADSPCVTSGLRFLEKFTPDQVDGSYSVGLQTIVYAEVDPQRYATRIAANVAWLERAQIKAGDNNPGWPGSWTHTSDKSRRGDNSSTQFAILGLDAAARAGIPVKEEVWALARKFLTQSQKPDGGWSYYPNVSNSVSTASMTCAGISGMILTGQRLIQGQEYLDGETIHDCGKGKVNPSIRRGLDWLAGRFSVRVNPGAWLPNQSWFANQWKYYYLYGMERVGRFAGIRHIGTHDWYREGAEELLANQAVLVGSWTGAAIERESIIATSFAVLFLATGRSPVLVNKLRHGPGEDWNNDPDDIRNLVAAVSESWKHLLTWQVIDPDSATVEQLLLAPIAYMSGHEAPEFSPAAKRNLREFLDQGGCLVAEACCGDPRFDRGFRALIEGLFPDPETRLRPLSDEHPIWRSRYPLSPDVHPLWGLERGCRTVIVYSPDDLSCSWNQMQAHPTSTRVIEGRRVGENIVDYLTGREIPADKLVVREVKDYKPDSPRRGSLQIAKLRHAGDWNVAPLAIPSLTNSLKSALGLDVTINHKELLPSDPNLVFYPLIYIHGRAAFSFSEEDLGLLRRHIDPGGGTFFADAACGSPAFDAAFRKFVAALFPDSPLRPIPRDDELYTTKVGYDLSEARFSKAAGGGKGVPQLEGIKLDDHWGLIYSRYDIGCALEHHAGPDCKGYTAESALKIATNIVIYSTLP